MYENSRKIQGVIGSFPFLPPSGLFPPPPVEAVAASTSVHVFIHLKRPLAWGAIWFG